MTNKPPFFASLPWPPALAEPPAWLVAALQNKVLLALNHVLQQEPQATERLRHQQGRVVTVHWDRFDVAFQVTPAGLLALAPLNVPSDLRLALSQTPMALAQSLWAGTQPALDIQGDVLLAADVAWLVDNVRWDLEEDLSHWVGDAVAHAWVGGFQTVVGALKGMRHRGFPFGQG